MTDEDFLRRIEEIIHNNLSEEAVDELVAIIWKMPEWVVIGADPMEGMVGEAPPDWTWNLN